MRMILQKRVSLQDEDTRLREEVIEEFTVDEELD
jgi:hypothetical protein